MDGVRKVADTGRTIVCTIHHFIFQVPSAPAAPLTPSACRRLRCVKVASSYNSPSWHLTGSDQRVVYDVASVAHPR
ncbi:hypothetical protein PF006_g30002 [Phytophthora fragariae]|uniref:Uncharacterized protein n=1 Tax=Phytophthora fragariae TaxID=53985 RepID=A0A6A3Q2Q0_9STRA|nr:hypothetical protein PF006_g30002 [Phytophthora fragariae]